MPTSPVTSTRHALSSSVSRIAPASSVSPASRWPAGWLRRRPPRVRSSTSRKRPSRSTIVATLTAGRCLVIVVIDSPMKKAGRRPAFFANQTSQCLRLGCLLHRAVGRRGAHLRRRLLGRAVGLRRRGVRLGLLGGSGAGVGVRGRAGRLVRHRLLFLLRLLRLRVLLALG